MTSQPEEECGTSTALFFAFVVCACITGENSHSVPQGIEEVRPFPENVFKPLMVSGSIITEIPT